MTLLARPLAAFVLACSAVGTVSARAGPGFVGFRGSPPPPPAALAFAASLDDYAVLQQKSGGDAYVYGLAAGAGAVSVKVSGPGCPSLTVAAELSALAAVAPRGRLHVSTLGPPPPPAGAAWKAKVPGGVGGDCTIVATQGKDTATLQHVTYGDVWYCGGQSNMALPVSNTFSRFASAAAIASGKYSNIRLKQLAGNMNPDLKWMNLTTAMGTNIVKGGWGGQNTSALFHFSATCYYFGESLTDELSAGGAKAPPIGLIHTAWGGSMIEQWLEQATVDECALSCSNVSTCGVGEWWSTRVLPYAGMTLKGWAWYQGENNMHGYFGNSAQHSGYACLAVKLVQQWRQVWAKNSGTSPSAPFGLVTLAASGGEGGADIGSIRYAQTGSWGVVPNPDMPNTFLAQAYDLDDPLANEACYHAGCCGNATKDKTPACQGCVAMCNGWSAGLPAAPGPRTCPQPSRGPAYDRAGCAPIYMGGIHPRDKKPVGNRLARAAAATVYAKGGPWTGPTITGCKKTGSSVTITFNGSPSYLGGDSLQVQPYNTSVLGASQMAVLVNKSNFCFQVGEFKVGAGGQAQLLRGRGHPSAQPCASDGFGQAGSTAVDESKDWVAVDVAAGKQPNTVVVDLAKAGGVAFAIRYGWLNGGSCCGATTGPTAITQACGIAQCPLMLKKARLPANPFMAKITADGKCECMPPQKCDA